MNSAIPKQFMLLKGKPVLYYSMQAFLETYDDMELILVLPEEYVAAGQEIIDAYFDHKRISITIGGETRFHSVQNGLKLIAEESIVFVHDAVRCLVSPGLIRRCHDAAAGSGSAVPVINCRDSVRYIIKDGHEVLDREKIKLIQTPQTFHSKILLPAFAIEYKDKFTDEATVVEAYGINVLLVEGEEDNIKITRPVDLMVAESILENRG